MPGASQISCLFSSQLQHPLLARKFLFPSVVRGIGREVPTLAHVLVCFINGKGIQKEQGPSKLRYQFMKSGKLLDVHCSIELQWVEASREQGSGPPRTRLPVTERPLCERLETFLYDFPPPTHPPPSTLWRSNEGVLKVLLMDRAQTWGRLLYILNICSKSLAPGLPEEAHRLAPWIQTSH